VWDQNPVRILMWVEVRMCDVRVIQLEIYFLACLICLYLNNKDL